MQNQSSKTPSPELIFNTIAGYQQSAVLKGAIELELFTAIGEGNSTVPAIAKRCNASERGIRILADYLAAMGMLTKTGATYGLSVDSATFLDKRSPAYIGLATKFMMSPVMTDAFRDVAATVRKGGTLLDDQGSVTPENPVWVDFARGMMTVMFPAAQAMTEIAGAGSGAAWKVLDVAAGHGIFGVLMAVRNTKAHVVALDWPEVLNVAEENARRHGVSERWSKLPGDALTVDYGKDYDLILLANFLHHFDPAGCDTILRKARAALKPGGRVVTLEFVPNEDRISPPPPAMFSMVMLASTPSGDAYTFAEFERMFKKAGFSRSELRELPNLPEQVIISYA